MDFTIFAIIFADKRPGCQQRKSRTFPRKPETSLQSTSPIPLDSSIRTGKRHEGNFNREQTLANLIKETSSQSNSLHVKIHTGKAYESNAIFSQ